MTLIYRTTLVCIQQRRKKCNCM